MKSLPTEIWSAALAVLGAIAAAIIGWISAKTLKKEDVVAANLRTQLDGWKNLAGDLQSQISYRQRQLEQYIAIIEKLREERSDCLMDLDVCRRGQIALYYQLNDMRRRLKLEPLMIPVFDDNEERAKRHPIERDENDG